MLADTLTQQHTANHLGSSREILSRIFMQPNTDGFIALESKQIVHAKMRAPRGFGQDGVLDIRQLASAGDLLLEIL